MKFSEVQTLSAEEIKKKLEETRESFFHARMKNSMGQLGNPMEVRFLRKDIARLKTALVQKLSR
ncbi:MAG: 50S ribosomal protein L29 [Bdellovibrionales bacterium CG10_big_fil_rev_8_21_14_0_10_45_34]|nr:MAG: 50S ribosomal protein L29 [Bdellovibrionales bacterium CG10_big_fil_rev_8_21_14_0_10_45_34]